MYEYFEQLLQERGITAAEVCRATGISSAHISTWKKRNGILGAEYLLKIAKFFGVPMEYFLGGNVMEFDESTNEVVQREEYYIDEEARELAQFLFKNPGHRILFDASKKVKPEDINKSILALSLVTGE